MDRQGLEVQDHLHNTWFPHHTWVPHHVWVDQDLYALGKTSNGCIADLETEGYVSNALLLAIRSTLHIQDFESNPVNPVE